MSPIPSSIRSCRQKPQIFLFFCFVLFHTLALWQVHIRLHLESLLQPHQVPASSHKGPRQTTRNAGWSFIYGLTLFHVCLYQGPFQKNFIKNNVKWHPSRVLLLFPFPASLVDPHRGWGRTQPLPDICITALSPSSSKILLLWSEWNVASKRRHGYCLWMSVPTFAYHFPWPHIITIPFQHPGDSWRTRGRRQGTQ